MRNPTPELRSPVSPSQKGREEERWVAPVYVRSFACLAGDCPDTCCSGLLIGLDADELVRLERAADTEELREAFETEVRPPPPGSPEGAAAVLHHPDGDCSFLTGERLCSIQTHAGEEALNATCRSFPKRAHRHHGRDGDQIEVLGTMGCPEMARLALTDPEAFEPGPAEEIPQEAKPAPEDPFRSLAVGLLTQPGFPFSARFMAVALALDACRSGSDLDDTLLALTAPGALEAITSQMDDLPSDPTLRASVAQDALVARAPRAKAKFRELVEEACFSGDVDPVDLESYFVERPQTAKSAEDVSELMEQRRGAEGWPDDDAWDLARAHYAAVQWMLRHPQTLDEACLVLGRIGLEIAAAELLMAAGTDMVMAFSRVSRELSHVADLSALLDDYVRERALDSLEGHARIRSL